MSLPPPPPSPTAPAFPRRSRRIPGLLLALGLLTAAGGTPPDPPAEPAAEPMRYGFSARMFEGINRNDAEASMKVWARQIARENGIPVSPEVLSYGSLAEIEGALNRGEVEALTVCTDEFFLLRDRVPVGTLVLSGASDAMTDEFLLLVRDDRDVNDLADLRGKSLTYAVTPRGSIIRHWLQAELLAGGLADFASFWGRSQGHSRLSKVVLPVFFGQTDACLITRSGFEIMAELNPQVGKRLKVVARSGPMIASVFFFRGTYRSDHVDRVIDIFTHAAEDPAAQQMLTLFQQDRLSVGSLEQLGPTLQMLERYFTLTRETGSTPIHPGTFPAE